MYIIICKSNIAKFDKWYNVPHFLAHRQMSLLSLAAHGLVSLYMFRKQNFQFEARMYLRLFFIQCCRKSTFYGNIWIFLRNPSMIHTFFEFILNSLLHAWLLFSDEHHCIWHLRFQEQLKHLLLLVCALWVCHRKRCHYLQCKARHAKLNINGYVISEGINKC